MDELSISSSVAAALPWQHPQWSRVCGQHQAESLPHAILITGVEGIGKAWFSLALAQWLLCENPGAGACGACRNCQLNMAETHPDLMNIGPEEKSTVIKIDQIRQLVDYINKTPQLAQRKIIRLGPAEKMNKNAANALLKSLEEPSFSTVLLLHSHRPSALPATIRSRCQRLEMPPPEKQQAESWLLPRLGSAEYVRKALGVANGRPIKAMELFDNGLVDEYSSLIQQLNALALNSVSAITLAAELKDVALEDLLSIAESYLHDCHKRLWRGTEQVECDLKILLDVITEIQLTRNSLQNGANPNRQLTLERVLSRFQGLSGLPTG